MSDFMGIFVVPGGAKLGAQASPLQEQGTASRPVVSEAAFFRTWHRNLVSNPLLPSWVLSGRLLRKGKSAFETLAPYKETLLKPFLQD